MRRFAGLLLVVAVMAMGSPAGAAAAKTSTTAKTPSKSTATSSNTASTARQAELNKQIASLKGQVAHASAEETALLGRLDDVTARRKILDGKVSTLDRQLSAVEGDLAAAEAGLEGASAEVVMAQTKLGAATAGLRESKLELRRRAIDAYVRNPETAAADLLLRSRDLRQVAAATTYLGSTVRVRAELVDRFELLSSEASQLQATVEARRSDAVLVRDLVATRRADVASAKAEQVSLRRQVAADEAEQQQLLGEVRRRKAEFQSQIASLKKESDSIGSFLRGLQKGQVAGGSGVLSVPIPGARLSSLFGPRIHPIYGTSRQHAGTDFAASTGTSIRAAAGGTVVHAGPRGGYGNTVIIDHGKALATLYAHQSAVLVRAGQRVSGGDVIGRVGSTGLSTGPHLHFEVRVNGNPVNPLSYL